MSEEKEKTKTTQEFLTNEDHYVSPDSIQRCSDQQTGQPGEEAERPERQNHLSNVDGGTSNKLQAKDEEDVSLIAKPEDASCAGWS